MVWLRLLASFALAVTLGCAAPHTSCNLNSDCHQGAYCTPTGCRTDCRINLDCPSAVCLLEIGRCVPLPDGGVPFEADLAMQQSTADLAMPGPTPDLSMGQPPLRSYGDVCGADGECESMICAKNPFSASDRECTGPCGKNTDCMIGDLCVLALNQCAQSDTGRGCMGGADCRNGLCVSVMGGNAPSFCTAQCGSAADCPAGYSCSPLSNKRVCIEVDATGPCNTDAECAYGTSCDAANHRCLGGCRNAGDCPLLHNCTNGLCAPKAPGRGGNGTPCNGPGDCRSGACLGSTCVARCGATSSVGQFCPPNWGCNPFSDGNGGNVLVCLPAGGKSPGAACTDNTDCASGLCLGQPGFCSRFCNSAPCPSTVPNCQALVVADGVSVRACGK